MSEGHTSGTSTIVILMGVCGCGKSTVGQELAKKLGWKFLEADDFHPLENKLKMSQGVPLNDQDRAPWLKAMNEALRKYCGNDNVVMACSALQRIYREALTQELQVDSPKAATKAQGGSFNKSNVLFVHLESSFETVARRLGQRQGHFMPTSLIKSQFETLEPPGEDEFHFVVNSDSVFEDIVSEIYTLITKEVTLSS